MRTNLKKKRLKTLQGSKRKRNLVMWYERLSFPIASAVLATMYGRLGRITCPR